jgi:HAD superfamily hydrolase (TIGR01509 family)
MDRVACRAVLFDFDGTLTRPGAIDFARLRGLLGCPPKVPILEYIDALADPAARAAAHDALDAFEREAARASVPNDGAEDLVLALARAGIARGILTRNSLASVREAMTNFSRLALGDFGAVVTREDDARPKPHPDGVHLAARLLGVQPAEMVVVGDYVFDIAAGRAAGASTVLLTNGGAQMHTLNAPGTGMDAVPDRTVTSLAELAALLGL